MTRTLQITYRNGKPMAAYLYLPRQQGDTSVRTERFETGLLLDRAADGRAIGIEITSPNKVSLGIDRTRTTSRGRGRKGEKMKIRHHNYARCQVCEIPDGVRFDTPRPYQGQIVEYSFGDFGRPENDEGAPYMSRHDKSLGDDAVEYFRLDD